MQRGSALSFDRTLVVLLALLLVAGCTVFVSAAFGTLARGGEHVSSVAFNHLALGVGLGLIGLIVTASIDYHVWRRFAPHIFVLALILTAAVFVPHVGMEHGGGRRWLLIAGHTFQPSELLKLATVILAASYFASIADKAATLRHGALGVAGILAVPALILILQPDLGTFGVTGIAAAAVYWMAGARLRDVALMALVALILLGGLLMVKDYARQRVVTFLNPAAGVQGEAYQINQALIAVGSGGWAGRGWGQGVQKFSYLPEPMGDSIFAVAGEEFGFLGAGGIVGLFLAFVLRGFAIAVRAPDPFGVLLAAGISTYLVIEAFINIAAMLGLAPLTGIPLTFISQGGSAMLVSLASAGILINISRRKGKKRA